MLTLSGHSEGAHCNLGPVMLCGLPDADEKDDVGTSLAGCTAAACKRKKSASAVPFRVVDLRAQVLNFFCCNSVATSGELYPSNVSLVLAAATGFASTLIGVNGLIRSRVNGALALSLLAETGLTAGELIVLLNSARALSTDCHPFVLFGDPLLRLPTRTALVRQAFKFNSEIVLQSGPALLTTSDDLPRVLAIRWGAGVDEESWPIRDGLLVVPVGSSQEHRVEVEDASARLEQGQAALSRAVHETRRAAAFERDLVGHARASLATDDVRAALLRVASARRVVERTAWWGLNESADSGDDGRWRESIDRASDQLLPARREWQEAVAGLIQRWNPTPLEFEHVLKRSSRVAPRHTVQTRCGLCSREVVARSYDSITGVPDYLSVVQCSCGYVQTASRSCPTSRLKSLRRDDRISIQVDAECPVTLLTAAAAGGDGSTGWQRVMTHADSIPVSPTTTHLGVVCVDHMNITVIRSPLSPVIALD
jgi:hypothetical protein